MKYKRKNNKNSIEIMQEKNNYITEDFDIDEYLDEEFIEDSKRSFFSRNKKQEYEYIIDEDDEEDNEQENKIIKENTKETNELKIEPIRTVTTEEYKSITRKRQEEKEKQLQLEKEKSSKKRKKKKSEPFKFNKRIIINALIFFILFLIIITMVDIVSVSKYGKGPYFAINTSTYDDGGTKIYHGIGYKVIKYKQVQGRRDIEIGTWSLQYDIKPITINDKDLAREFKNNDLKAYDIYYKEFVRINSTLKKVNKKNNTLIIGYEDENNKYTMNINCKIANKKINLDKYEIGKATTIIGIVSKYSKKNSTNPLTITINNCFAEQ